ncbi:MAG: hypothetical protein FJ033_09275 [Chloroflexi bacterium]|nr:hypothetical protein [Chloroflexota bacterium]
MEVRAYGRILWRRRGLVLVVSLASLIVAIVSVLSLPQPLPSYQATVILSARPKNIPALAGNQYGDYYLYIASEFLNDDLITLAESHGFFEAIQRRYAGRPEGPPFGSISGRKTHRVVTFSISSNRASDALALAQGVIDVFLTPHEGEPRYLAAVSAQDPDITILDPPRLTAEPGVRRGAIDVGIRALLGILAGIGLALFLHYIDPTLRDRDEVETALGAPVLVEIPGR